VLSVVMVYGVYWGCNIPGPYAGGGGGGHGDAGATDGHTTLLTSIMDGQTEVTKVV
jgi:hypothetical protein